MDTISLYRSKAEQVHRALTDQVTLTFLILEYPIPSSLEAITLLKDLFAEGFRGGLNSIWVKRVR